MQGDPAFTSTVSPLIDDRREGKEPPNAFAIAKYERDKEEKR